MLPHDDTSLDFFDLLACENSGTAQTPTLNDAKTDDSVAAPFAQPSTTTISPTAKESHRTPLALRSALQDLLKNGWLEESAKPRLFKTIAMETERINQLLEPLDLEAKIDELRGLAFASVLPDYSNHDAEADEWSHPLVFRQRLTLEHSLMLAILRREFIQQEQQGGMGIAVRLAIDDLMLQLDTFIDRSGSDTQDRKRLLTALEALRKHGVVSEVDAQDYISIRPMIVHLANPQNLQTLLLHLKNLATASHTDGTGEEDLPQTDCVPREGLQNTCDQLVPASEMRAAPEVLQTFSRD